MGQVQCGVNELPEPKDECDSALISTGHDHFPPCVPSLANHGAYNIKMWRGREQVHKCVGGGKPSLPSFENVGAYAGAIPLQDRATSMVGKSMLRAMEEDRQGAAQESHSVIAVH
jgi:hypothetical protein